MDERIEKGPALPTSLNVCAAERPRILPHRPGPLTVKILCPRCTNWLGERDGPWLWVDHKRRHFLASLPARIECERCGHRVTITEQVAA